MTNINVLVLGSGGREHALSWKIAQSAKLGKLYCLPGNPGTAAIAENIAGRKIVILFKIAEIFLTL